MKDNMRRQNTDENVYKTDELRAAIQSDVERFLASGNQITEIAMGQGVGDYSTYSQQNSRKRGKIASMAEARR